jgi:hypothetical protein
MKATFVESTGFTEAITEVMSDDDYAELQRTLMEDVDAGSLIRGCGGLRKIRAARSKADKGKRGGIRIIYLHVPIAERFYMLDVYSKNEKSDLSASEKKQLKQLAEQLKREALAAHGRRRTGKE